MWKIIDQLGLFFVNVFNALKFAAYDYDAKLKITKTPKQRFLIWFSVALLSLVSIYIFFSALVFLVKFILKK